MKRTGLSPGDLTLKGPIPRKGGQNPPPRTPKPVFTPNPQGIPGSNGSSKSDRSED